MSSSLRDLNGLVAAVTPPDLDVDALITRGEARLRRRRLAAVLGTTIAIVLAVAAATALPDANQRSTVPAVPPTLTPAPHAMVPDVDVVAHLQEGPYGLTPIGADSGPLAVVDIPDGFVATNTLLFPADETGQADECCIVGYWSVARVYQDPCTQRVATNLGPSVQDLADALVAQRTGSTKPKPVTLGGHDGLYLELTAPTGLGDLSSCKDGVLAYWDSDPGTRWFDGSHYHPSKGLPLERVWIIDVEGQRVLLSVGTESGIDDQHAQPLIDIVESAQFVTS